MQVFDQVRKFGEELEKRTAMLDTITLERDRALYDLKEEKIKRDRLSKIMDVQINDLQEEAIGLRNQRDQIQ